MFQDVGLRTGIHLWFMLEGALLNLFFYFLLVVQKFLNSLFPEQWVGRGGLRACAAYLSPPIFTSAGI
jgi:hypothetical protein